MKCIKKYILIKKIVSHIWIKAIDITSYQTIVVVRQIESSLSNS